VRIVADIYRIVPTPIPLDENWGFRPDEFVRCVRRRSRDGRRVLAAVRRVGLS